VIDPFSNVFQNRLQNRYPFSKMKWFRTVACSSGKTIFPIWKGYPKPGGVMPGIRKFMSGYLQSAKGFMKLFFTVFLGVIMVCLSGCGNGQTGIEEQLPGKTVLTQASWDKPKEYSYKVIKKIRSDPRAFTQGFVVHNGLFYLGTGGNRSSSKITGRQSSIIKMDMQTGDILSKQELSTKYFGEGITILNDFLYQLTWKNQTAFVYPVEGLNITKPFRTFKYPMQGWGLTHDGEKLIMSDGTATLYFINPKTFKIERRLPVKDRDDPVLYLNELEFVEGEVFANVYQKDRVAIIAPDTGRVTGWIDFRGLRGSPGKFPGQDVLNGIAYDSEKKRLYLTGKLWEHIFEVKIINKS
jgi:glutamine cyclotransferase